MSKLDVILGITAGVSLIAMMKLYKENQKISTEAKKHKCKIGTTFCNDRCCYYCEGNYKCKMHCKDDPLVCGSSREE